jgi:hypothetical protein
MGQTPKRFSDQDDTFEISTEGDKWVKVNTGGTALEPVDAPTAHGTGSVGEHGDFDLTDIAFDDIPKWDGAKFTMQPDTGGIRSRAVSVVTETITAGTTISGVTSANTDAALLDYSGVTLFADDVEIHINGRILRGAAATGFDVYPAGTDTDGDFACDFDLDVGDTIQMFIGDIGGVPGGGSEPWLEDIFVPTLGQVTFILSQIPTEPISLMMNVNGIEVVVTADYTLSGTNITWLNPEFSMETSDGVVIQYK